MEEILKHAAYVVAGEARVGGQEHFYLECQGAIAIPKKEHGEMEVICTNQVHITFQFQTATILYTVDILLPLSDEVIKY